MDTKDAGRIGGSKTSKRKARTARENGKKGGRPVTYHLDNVRTGLTFCGIVSDRCGEAERVNCKRCISAYTNQNQ